MLYDLSLQPWSQEEFRRPSKSYRSTPFWAWNSLPQPEEMTRQISILDEMGFGGFHIHVRTGLQVEYLGERYLQLVRHSLEQARSRGMTVWLYDEDRWPSGVAGGLVTRNPEYNMRYLLLTRIPYGSNAETKGELVQRGAFGMRGERTEQGQLLACYDVTLSEDGHLAGYLRVEPGCIPTGFLLYAYLESAPAKPRFNNNAYVDTLRPDAIAEFLRITHDSYYSAFPQDFGTVIPAIFTDEPQYMRKGLLSFAEEQRDVTLPWTPGLEQTFEQTYPGGNLLEHLPELLWNPPDAVSQTRYRYHNHVTDRFCSAFSAQCGAWCAEHKISLTGHIMEEHSLESQTAASGDVMRSLSAFQLPGIDMLMDSREFTTAKQAQSVARQYGRAGVLSELYGVTNWDFDFRGHKLQGDWQAAMGVTVRVLHHAWMSMAGESKRDFPASIFYQSPWHQKYHIIEDHFARVNTAMTRGKPKVEIAVLHPIESYWLHWANAEQTHAVREQLDTAFASVTQWLCTGLLDFDYLNESLLPELCDPTEINTLLPVGEMQYRAVVVPCCHTLRSTTLERLERFHAAGGTVLFIGDAPLYTDACPNPRARKLYEACKRIDLSRASLLEALKHLRDVDIRMETGALSTDKVYQLRTEGTEAWLFVAQAYGPEDRDIDPAQHVRIRVRGEYCPVLLNTMTGEQSNLEACQQDGWTEFADIWHGHDSRLIRLTKTQAIDQKNPKPSLKAAFTPVAPCLDPVPVTLQEPNVLLLDIARSALDNAPLGAEDEILRIDSRIRQQLGWPARNGQVTQPYAIPDEPVCHYLTLEYVFESELPFSGARLALEHADITEVTLNGEPSSGMDGGWYVDHCFQTIGLPVIRAGENRLVLRIPYGVKTNVEACYILGEFGVRVQGCRACLTKPVRTLAFGDITRQGLPFYGGNITYHLKAESEDALTIRAPYYRGALLSVSVDGRERGEIIFSPYSLNIGGLGNGTHTVDITLHGTRINTFGALHRNDRNWNWWGPGAWRATDDAWTWEYRFWEQGLMKSPEVYRTGAENNENC